MIILAYIFARIGSKRVIGAVDSFLLCLLIFPVGCYMVLNSRRLDDEQADKAMEKKFAPKTPTN